VKLLYMTWVKICGITNLEDALVAVAAGADALGFVFYEKSPRKVDVETARSIVEKLPLPVEKVGVFVNGSTPDWLQVLHIVALTAVQHVDTGNQYGWAPQKAVGLGALPRPLKIYVSLPIAGCLKDEDQVQALAGEFARLRKNISDAVSVPDGIFDTFFLDSGNAQQPGGTGETLDWRKAVPIAEGMRQGGLKLVVAGGLNPDNVAEAIEVLQPWGVDVSSGVEAQPGKKDPEKVRAFVQAVRRTEKGA
jgi:phosphoribosylanthranilate isomerase